MITTLILAGLLAGLIQYFVDFKGLPLYQPPKNEKNAFADATPTDWERFIAFLRAHWQFFGYMIIGIAGAMLVPLFSEFSGGKLIGLSDIKNNQDCIPGGIVPCPPLSTWDYLVLFGYGIISGYSAVRIIRNFGAVLMGSVAVKQDKQQQDLELAMKKIKDLESNIDQFTKVPMFAPTESKMAVTVSGSDVFDRTPNSLDDAAANGDDIEAKIAAACEENITGKPWKIGDSVLAGALVKIRDQVNALAPKRNKASDGWFGDEAHQGTDSDHNPWVWNKDLKKGVVTAIDITHDKGKCDCQAIADSLKANKDSRIKYVIWNKQIMSSAKVGTNEAWTWRKYTGDNAHDKHIHISVKCDKDAYGSNADWTVTVL